MNQAIILHSEQTWPSDLIQFLDDNQNLFVSWELKDISAKTMDVSHIEYDEAICALNQVLQPYLLKGFHCKKLTENEIGLIIKNGMQLQDGNILNQRIDKLSISEHLKNRLKIENQANEEYRAHMLWFSFYQLDLIDEDGIVRFFRSWGGEALYNSHESDPETGQILKNIGIPCVIKADVPISSFDEHNYLAAKTYRNYLKQRGFDIRECCNHEGYAIEDISAKNIIQILKYPDKDFIELTKCNEWDESLSAF